MIFSHEILERSKKHWFSVTETLLNDIDVGDVKNKTITTFSLFLLQTQPGWIATHEEGGIRI